MNNTYRIVCIALLASLSGCHSLSKASTRISDQVLDLLGKEKAPEITQPTLDELNKAAQERLEKLLNNMPVNQWVYLDNPQLGSADLQNKSSSYYTLSLRLNCKISSQRPDFKLLSADGQTLLKAYDDSAGTVQFLLDNKNYGNPFDLHSRKKLDSFKSALASAKVIKIFNASKLYSFQNQQAELLEKPVSCAE